MENNHFILKISRLFPSSLTSCQFQTLPDVAECSITLTKPHESDRSSSALPTLCKRNSRLSSHPADARGRICPPATPLSAHDPKEKEKPLREYCGKAASAVVSNVNQMSSSSNSGWFSSSDEKTRPDDDAETDAFFSLSSNSGDSFRLIKTGRRSGRRRKEMKSIDETSSVASFDTVITKCSRKTATSAAESAVAKEGKDKTSRTVPEYEPGSDHISTPLYYAKSRHSSETSSRRRKAKRSPSRRSMNAGSSSVVEESYAVEKSSRDPRSDFRASMLEMIVEKRLFGAEDLERLLLCFLSLNSASYHALIFEVFSEICETLFSN